MYGRQVCQIVDKWYDKRVVSRIQEAGGSEYPGRWPAPLRELRKLEARLGELGDYEAALQLLSGESLEILMAFRDVCAASQDLRQHMYLNGRPMPEKPILDYTVGRRSLEESLRRSCGWDDEQITRLLMFLEDLVASDWRATAVAAGGADVRDALMDSPRHSFSYSLAEVGRITRLAISGSKKAALFRQCWQETMQATRYGDKCLKDLVAAIGDVLSPE